MPDYSKYAKSEGPARKTLSGDKKPVIFLWLASVAIVLALLTYVFNQELYDRQVSGVVVTILYIVTVVFALFFLACYRTPRLARKLMGREAENVDLDPGASVVRERTSGVSWNAFRAESVVEAKALQSQRKLDRYSRRKIIQATREMELDVIEAKPAEETPGEESNVELPWAGDAYDEASKGRSVKPKDVLFFVVVILGISACVYGAVLIYTLLGLFPTIIFLTFSSGLSPRAAW